MGTDQRKIVVIGAGIGGLAAACLLAKQGNQVDLYERNSTPGGKMQEICDQGFRFDTGPSLLTMPFLLQKLFETCGASLDHYLTFRELDPICRYIYTDGIIFDNYSDKEKSCEQISSFAPEDSQTYKTFLDRSEEIYNATSDAFLFNPLFNVSDLQNLDLTNLLRIDAFSTVSKKVDEYFQSDYLRKFFKRFTTYNGSSPFKAPATLNVIPHVELNQGGFYVHGGMYTIARSLYRLAESLGVSFHFSSEVTAIATSGKTVTGCEINYTASVQCDDLVSNADASETILNLLPGSATSTFAKKKQQLIEPSCSGFVLMLGCQKKWDLLNHHTIFFSDNYYREFDEIFRLKKLPEDPTVYIANTSRTDPEDAPPGCSNLFILVNAPYITDFQDWDELSSTYPKKLIQILEKRGLQGLSESVISQQILTPQDFYTLYLSNKGSIYGTSSNSTYSAFLRPRNKNRSLKNLYLTGGSTHPGGGIPLVIQSAFNAVELMQRYNK